MGNFTTAKSAIKLGRIPIGFELNTASFVAQMDVINGLSTGYGLEKIKKVRDDVPKNQGKRISIEEQTEIVNKYKHMKEKGLNKSESIHKLCAMYERGRFSILNIINRPL
jgi:hypothetical protein